MSTTSAAPTRSAPPRRWRPRRRRPGSGHTDTAPTGQRSHAEGSNRGPRAQTAKAAYTTTGGRVPDEHALGLPGYPGGADVAGNWVNDQFQLDAFGEALLLF